MNIYTRTYVQNTPFCADVPFDTEAEKPHGYAIPVINAYASLKTVMQQLYITLKTAPLRYSQRNENGLFPVIKRDFLHIYTRMKYGGALAD